MPIDKAQLGNNLRELRTELQLTQAELAARVGVTRKTINTVENRVFVPSTILALKLSEVLKVAVEENMKEREDKVAEQTLLRQFEKRIKRLEM